MSGAVKSYAHATTHHATYNTLNMQGRLSRLILRHFKQFVTFASLAERFPLLWDVHLEVWRKRGDLTPPFYAKHSSTLTTRRIAADNKED